MKRGKRLAAAAALTILSVWLAGCTVTPRPVYRAHPVEGSGIWNNGTELVELQQDGLEVVATCEGFQHGRLVFLVEVANDTDAALTVDPAAFFLENPGTGNSPWMIAALDPEAQLLAADLSRSRAVARRQSRQNTDMLFSLAEVVASVAETGQEVTPEQKRQRHETDEDIARLQEEERLAHQARMEAVGRQQYLWANETLRKTTLAPGQMIGGRVRFPMGGEALPWDLVLPLGEATLRVPYQVEMHRP